MVSVYLPSEVVGVQKRNIYVFPFIRMPYSDSPPTMGSHFNLFNVYLFLSALLNSFILYSCIITQLNVMSFSSPPLSFVFLGPVCVAVCSSNLVLLFAVLLRGCLPQSPPHRPYKSLCCVFERSFGVSVHTVVELPGHTQCY